MTLSPPSSRSVLASGISSGAAADGTVLTADGAGASAFEAATGGLTVLFDSTLGAGAAIIDTGAGGIAQTATSLLIRMMVRTDEVAAFGSVLLRVNGNSGTNYDRQYVRGLNATASAAASIGGTSWQVPCAGASSLAGTFGFIEYLIPFYTATTALKGGLIKVGVGGDTATEMIMEEYATSYRSAGAITQFSVAIGGGTELVIGSRLQVLGSV